MWEKPPYWDDIPADLREAMEEVIRNTPESWYRVFTPGTPEHEAKMEAGRQAVAEFERENGPFTEEDKAWARAVVERTLGVSRARRHAAD